MINRTNLTKKQVKFLNIVDWEIAKGLDDANNSKTHGIDEVKTLLKQQIRNNKNANTKQWLWVLM